jgi:putative chitinase
MINRRFFFNQIRTSLFDGATPVAALEGLEALLDEWETHHESRDDRWLAYILATVHYETDRSFKPMSEGGARARHLAQNERATDGRGEDAEDAVDEEEWRRYFGRGFVLLTYKSNYDWVGSKIGVDLLNDPDRALDLRVASRVMIAGMRHGWFTGRKLSDYLNGQKEDWVGARQVVNGTSKANLVAGYALHYYAAISYCL